MLRTMGIAQVARRRRVPGLALAGALPFAFSPPALAEPSAVIGPETFSASFDLRAVAADGEPSWTDSGFGKARFDGDEGEAAVRPVAAHAALIWEPRLGWDLGATIVVAAQHEQDEPVDLVEAFLAYKPVPRSSTRLSARAGLFWPPVSLEHEGASWSVTGMITPSAINSWIGEEVKVVGAEATAAREVHGNRLAATFGLFGVNDTAGTLIAFRGWALHDLKAGAFGHQPLPRLNQFMQFAQAPATRPLIELDGRIGFYGKLGWQLRAPIRLEAFYYDNRGDPEAVNDELQWGWETRFLNLGARIDFGDRTWLLAQALTGATKMGFRDSTGRYWVETRFRSGFARLSHRIGALALTGRADWFETREEGSQMDRDESERGWALAAAASWAVSDQAEILVEGLHVDSERGVRRRDGLEPRQRQNVAQLALRITL
jgi:hypothetical protein